MNKLSAILATVIVGSFSHSAYSAELVLAGGQAKSSRAATSISIDIVSEGNVRGFDVVIPVPKGAKVDTSKCLSNLPQGFQSRCAFNGDEVAIIAVTPEKKGLSAGIHSIGSISVSGGTLPKTLKVQFNAIDVNGNEITSSVHSEL